MTQNETLHLAAQYLATTAKCFVKAKADDSHTSLGWNADEKQLESKALNSEGLKLALNYGEYSLDFTHPKSGVEASYPLVGARHHDIVHWIMRESKFAGLLGEYEFNLHYELPYKGAFNADFIYPEADEDELAQLIQLRWLADKSIAAVAQQFRLMSEVRVWPHHFDTGAIGYFDASKKVSVGIGLAIPDKMLEDWYFYAAGYHGSDPIKTDEFKPLKNGSWRSGDWNGATLEAKGKSMPVVASFLSEAIRTF